MNPPVFVAAGALTGFGFGAPALRQITGKNPRPSLHDLDPSPLLGQRKMAKSVSRAAGLVLAAGEDLKSNLPLHAPTGPGLALFLSSPAPYASDKLNYRAAAEAADLRSFAALSVRAQPITGLLGLPNAALCYTSIVLQAFGRNATYVSGETGGHLALLRAAQTLRNGRAELAVAGGFALPSEPSFAAFRRDTARFLDGHTWETAPADAAILFALAPDTGDERHGGWLVGGAAVCGAKDPADGVRRVIQTALSQAGVAASAIGLVMVSTPSPALAAAARRGVATAFDQRPCAVLDTAPVLGDLAEASGLAEILLIQALAQAPDAFPWPLFPDGPTAASLFDRQKPYRLILALNTFGEQTCLLIRPCPSL